MKLGNIVKIKDQRRGKIVQIQSSISGRKIYVVEFTKNVSDGFFEEELELIDDTTAWFNIFEVIQELYKDQNKRAMSKKGEIKWIGKTLDNHRKMRLKTLFILM